jgi:hypothetical protein
MSKKGYLTSCYVYEIRHTYNAEIFPNKIKGVRKWFEGIAKKYVFQIEKGDSGYIHVQGRISLCKKRRKPELLKLFKSTKTKLAPMYLEPTTNKEHTKVAFYVLKEDTRLEGPFADTDEIKVETKQLQLFKGYTLRPYQQSIIDKSSDFCMRTIDLIYDTTGNCGKSMLSEYMEYLGLAEEIPPFRLMDDIFQWVCTRPIKKSYIVDMPRGMKKDRLGDFYSGIEVIKNGVAYDKRYNAKKIRFDRPRIFVFTNTLPNLDLMSRDRWNVWIVTKDFKLKMHSFSC